MLTAFSSSSPDCGGAAAGQSVSVSGAFTDVNLQDIHSATIDWGDGSPLAPGTVTESGGSGSVSANHEYANGGIYTVIIHLKDDGDATSVKTAQAVITGAGVNNGVLYIIGTDGRDIIHVHRHGNVLVVHSLLGVASHQNDDAGSDNEDDNADEDSDSDYQNHPTASFNVATVQSVVIYACGGNDHVYLSRNITLPTTIDGGTGNDWLHGGGGNDTIVDLSGDNHIHAGAGNNTITTGSGNDRIWSDDGNDIINAGDGNNTVDAGAGDDYVRTGSGNDTIDGGDGNDVILAGGRDDMITGGAGNDFLIGGAGKDKISGGTGNDILVAGDIDYSLSLAALQSISQAWVALHNTVEALAVDDLIDETTDALSDTLTGGAGADLFIINTGDTITDFQFGKPKTNKDGDVVIKNGVVTT